MIKRNEKYYLAGLHFSGDDDEKNGTSEALPWNDIQEYLGHGVAIVAGLETYMACSKNEGASFKEVAEESKSNITSKAQENKLTIYLCNGEVFN